MDNFTLDKVLSEINSREEKPTDRYTQEVLVLLNHLEQLGAAGTSLLAFENPVRMLDNRCQALLLNLNFDPSDTPHLSLFKKSEDERLRDIQEVAETAIKAPESAIPYVIDGYCRSIRDDVDNDLLAFATDFAAGLNLRFRISFAPFASSFSSLNSDTDKKRIQKRLQEMKEEGFVIGASKRRGKILIDCDENRRLLREYCREKFGTEPEEILAHKDFIRGISMSIQYDKYIPASPDQKNSEPPSDSLTADNAIRLKKAVSDAKSALGCYQIMKQAGSGNITLSCLRSCIREIETATGVHSTIWNQIEKETMEVRKKNQRIREIEENIRTTAAAALIPKLRDHFMDARENLEDLASSMGLYLDSFELMEYNRLVMVLSKNSLVYKEPDVTVDGLMEDGTFYVFNTDKNMETILATVRATLPSAELESYEVRKYAGTQYISKVELSTSVPMEMMRAMRLEG